MYVKRKRLTRQESRKLTRVKLAEAAERMFVRRGFDATSVEQIAAQAGFSRGAFYSNYADKDEIFVEVLEKRLREARHALQFAFAKSADPADRFRTAREWYAGQWWPHEWAVLRTEFHLRALRNRKVRERLSALLDQELSENTAMLKQYYGEAHLSPPDHPQTIALILFVLSTGLGTLSLLDSGPKSRERAAAVRSLAFDRLLPAPLIRKGHDRV